jgi:uncharacterized protein YjdB
MSFEPVDVYVLDDTASNDPIDGVLVKVYDSTGTTFYTQSTTDALGHVGFMLETLSYTLRFYKFQVGFTQPQAITVIGTNDSFNVYGSVFELPIATDSRLCRCSGYFRDVTGAVKANLDIHIEACFDPLILENAGIITDLQRFKTDEEGYVQFDLIRNGMYVLRFEALEDIPRTITVPDAASANLPDVAFPVVESVTLDPEGPYVLAVDEELELTPTVLASSGLELVGAALSDVQWSSSDSSIVSVSPATDIITLRGVAAGSANLLAVRRDNSIVRIPEPGITGVPIAITVS